MWRSVKKFLTGLTEFGIKRKIGFFGKDVVQHSLKLNILVKTADLNTREKLLKIESFTIEMQRQKDSLI